MVILFECDRAFALKKNNFVFNSITNFTQDLTMNVVPVGPDPSQVTCPSCRAVIVTKVTRKSTTKTHVIALLLCLFLCWPCVCVPYCTDSCQNADHYCPNCNSYLGTYQR